MSKWDRGSNWRQIEDAPNYWVSCFGDVYSTKRDRLLKPVLSKRGYLRVKLPKIFKIHRLVAEAFLGPCLPGHEVCHNDGNKLNNRLDNLRYGTRAENIHDRIEHGVAARGNRNGKSKLSEADVLEIVASNKDTKLLAKQHGVSTGTIRRIKNGSRWGWLTKRPCPLMSLETLDKRDYDEGMD